MGHNLDWLYSHATRLAQKFGVNKFLKKHHVVCATAQRFADDWRKQVSEELRRWKPETIGKLVVLGAANYTSPIEGLRTPMGDVRRKTGGMLDNLQNYTSSLALSELGVMVLLAAIYDITVVTEGRRRSQRGVHTFNDNGRQIEIPNPYWREEAVDRSVILNVRLAGRYEDEYPDLEPEDIHIP